MLTWTFRFGSPKDLFESKGLFYDMIYHSGEMEELKTILNADGDKDAASTQSSTTQVEQAEQAEQAEQTEQETSG